MTEPKAARRSAVRVRDAKAGDIVAITAIYTHHVLHGLASFEETPPDPEEMERRFQAIAARGLPYLVAERDGGTVQGYAYAGAYRDRPGYRYSVENSVYVAPEALGKGMGKALLEEVIRRCADLGYRQMVAVIGDSENWSSIRLHESLGFRRVGTLAAVGFKFGRWIDSVILQRALGDGETNLPKHAPGRRISGRAPQGA